MIRAAAPDPGRDAAAGVRPGGRARADLDPDQLTAPERSDPAGGEGRAEGKLVELRSFAGLTLDDAAAVLGVSPAKADRYWSFPRAGLYQDLGGNPVDP
jgi:ECF sigma factor